MTAINNISADTAWDMLSNTGGALIDVRTQAEWMFVGVPDTTSLNIHPIFIEWQSLPNMQINSQFPAMLEDALQKAGATKETALFFLCRSGQRSLNAARLMAEAGYANCYNISDGFEGPLSPDRHRGQEAGWKAAGLPWVQS